MYYPLFFSSRNGLSFIQVTLMFCALFIKYDEDRFTAKNWRNCIVNRVFVNNSITLVKKYQLHALYSNFSLLQFLLKLQVFLLSIFQTIKSFLSKNLLVDIRLITRKQIISSEISFQIPGFSEAPTKYSNCFRISLACPPKSTVANRISWP